MRKSVNKNRLLEEIFKSIDAEYERIRGESQTYKELKEGCERAWKEIAYREPEISMRCSKRFAELLLKDLENVEIKKKRG